MPNTFAEMMLRVERSIRWHIPLLPKLPPKRAIASLSAVVKILDNSANLWWIADGTLLGQARSRSLIRRDNDIDFGLEVSAWDPTVIDELEKVGFILHRVYGDWITCLQLSFVRDLIPIDLTFFYEVHGRSVTSGFDEINEDTRTARLIDYTFSQFGLTHDQICGVRVKIPNNVERYLTEQYGAEWRIPRVSWSYALDPSNARIQARRVPISAVRPPLKVIRSILSGAPRLIQSWEIE